MSYRQHCRPWRRTTERIRDVLLAGAMGFALAWLAAIESFPTGG